MMMMERGWKGRGEVPPGVWETQSVQGEKHWLPQHQHLTSAVPQQLQSALGLRHF